jgi:hypothetical protein
MVIPDSMRRRHDGRQMPPKTSQAGGNVKRFVLRRNTKILWPVTFSRSRVIRYTVAGDRIKPTAEPRSPITVTDR